MTVIGRYLAREIAVGVVFVLAGFLALFAFFDVINELDDLGRGGYRLQHALGFVALSLPGHAYELVPIAVLIGGIYALAQFAQHSEYTAMRAAGLSRRRALASVAGVGLVFVLLTFAVGEMVAPAADRLAQRVRLSALGATVGAQFRSGLWMKDTVRDPQGGTAGQRFVNVAQVMPDTTIRGVQVYEFDPQFRLRSILRAEAGRWEPAPVGTGRAVAAPVGTSGAAPATAPGSVSGSAPGSAPGDGGHWRLTGVRETRFLETTGAAGVQTLRAAQAGEPERQWRSELTPAIVSVLMVDPDRMAIWDLWPYIRHLQDNRQNTSRYENALWKKIVYPFGALVMMVLALPFAYMQVRAGGIGLKVFAGIMLGVAFHFLNGLFSHLGLLNTWPAWLSASIPSLLACAVGFGMLWWVERTR